MSAKKSTSKTAAKKATKKTATKAATKQAAKKAAAKQPAKKAASKQPAKKAASKKTAGKKADTRRPSAKKAGPTAEHFEKELSTPLAGLSDQAKEVVVKFLHENWRLLPHILIGFLPRKFRVLKATLHRFI